MWVLVKMGRETDPLLPLNDLEAEFRHLPFDQFWANETTAVQLPVFLQGFVLICTKLEGDGVPCPELPGGAFKEFILVDTRDRMEQETSVKRESSLVPGRPCCVEEGLEPFGVRYVPVFEGEDRPPTEEVQQGADDAF